MTYQEFKNTFNKALKLRDQGDPQAAVQVLSSLLGAGHAQGALVGMLGMTIYYRLNDAERALPFLQEAVAMHPNHERSSLALFHALFTLNRAEEAFDEVSVLKT